MFYSLSSTHSVPKELKQSSIDKTMDTSGRVKLHIANVPYEMTWQELKDLLRDKGRLCNDQLYFAIIVIPLWYRITNKLINLEHVFLNSLLMLC